MDWRFNCVLDLDMSFWENNIGVIVGTIASIFTGVLGFTQGKKNRDAQAKTQNATAFKGMQEAYDNLVKDINANQKELKDEIKDLKNENFEQRATIREIQKDYSKLHQDNIDLHKMITRLKEIIKELEGKNNLLRLELKRYKKHNP